MYTISSKELKTFPIKVVETQEEAIKLLKQLTNVFGVKFEMETTQDVWKLDFYA